MDFRFTPEEETFRQEVRDYAQQVLPPDWSALDPIDVAPEINDFVRREMKNVGAKGWLSLSWPKEYGGREASMLDTILQDELAYYRLPVRDVQGVGNMAPTLIHFGNDEQRQKYLPPIARGETLWCQGYSEPGAGSDLAGISTRAIPQDDHFVVNGQKTWTSFAHQADWIYFLARSSPDAPRHQGISFLLADMKTPGITVNPIIDITGNHTLNETFFDNVQVPRENMIGELHRGWYVAVGLLEFERSGASYLGASRRLLDDLVGFANEGGLRHPLLRKRLADSAVELEVARWMSYRTAWMHQHHMGYSLEPPMAKVFMTEMMQRAGHLGTEVLGLYGQLERGSPWAPLKGSVAFLTQLALRETILAGTSEIQRMLIATRGLGLPR
jgi:alkylation response protein AidB-like acyl-CoA dehydrogenase